MRRIMPVILLIIVILVPELVWAGPKVPAGPQLTDVRWAVHVDAASGASKIRLVIETNGPVSARGTLSSGTQPRLTVDIAGAGVGKCSGSRALDGKIADQVSFSAVNSSNSQVTVDLPSMISGSDYNIFTLPANRQAARPFRVVVDINKPVAPTEFNFTSGLRGKIIVIDPGHGGTDPGAIGPNNIQEKDVTLAVALKLQALLKKAGAKPVLTHQDDRDVFGPNASDVDELKARTMVAANSGADVFLSIHANSFSSRSVGGTSTYYYQKSAYDVMLAQSLQDEAVQYGKLTDRGIIEANFYVIKRTAVPAALVEMAFISNPNEENLLNSPSFQEQMAEGLCRGLDDFFTKAAKQGGSR